MEQCPVCQGELAGALLRQGKDLDGAVVEGKYELVQLLGEGGMAWVYEAVQRSLGRRVAIKLMKPVPNGSAPRSRRFLREATTAARLMHPHIVTIIDSGVSPGGLHYIATEYLEGRNLGQVIYHDGAVPLGRALGHLNQIMAGVEHAHEHGVIHRDLKPDNIMLVPGRREVVKVLDFGIAWTADAEERLTSQGQAVGTPAYMATEQIKGGEIGPWTDVYALGVILFEMLTGRLPFEAKTVSSLMRMHLQEDVPAAHEKASGVPEAVSELIRKAMAKQISSRIGSVAELRQGLVAAMPEARSCMDCCDACHHHHPDPLEYCPGDSPASMLVDWPLTAQSRDLESMVPRTIIAKNSVGKGATPEQPPTRLAGREAELARVLTLLRGAGPLAQVLGPHGAGKTALLDEVALALAARTDPPRLLRAGRDPWHTRAPWYPVRRLVSMALGLDVGARQERGGVPDVATLREAVQGPGLAPEDLPGLLALFDLEQRPERVAARFREVMCASLRALVARASPGGLCVLVDDADELDSCSLRFLEALAQMSTRERGPGLVLAGRAPLALANTDCRVPLSPLGPGYVQTMLATRHPSLDRDLADALRSRCGGNALHLEQAARLVEEDRLEQAPDGSLEQVISRRLQLLPDAARRLLRALSLTALGAPGDLLTELEPDLSSSLDTLREELEERGFVRPNTGKALVLAHPLLAEVVRRSMSLEAQQRLHRRLHAALSGRGADPLVLAHHAFEGRMGEVSLAAQEQAGDLARRWLDDEGAGLTHYQRALHVARWELAPDVDGEQVFDLSLKMGHALRRAGHQLGAEEALNGSMDFIEPDAGQRARFHVAMGRLLRTSGRSEEAEDHLRQACDGADDAETLLRAHSELADLLTAGDASEEARAVLEQGLHAVKPDEDGDEDDDVHGHEHGPVGAWRLGLRLAALASLQKRAEQSRVLAQEALSMARREGSEEGMAQCYMVLGRLLQRDDPDAAREHLSTASVLFLGLGDRKGAARGLLLQASQQQSAQLAFKALTLARQIQWSAGKRKGERRLG